MAPTLIHLSAQLRQLIYYQLDNNLLQDALFLASRLHALDFRNQDSIHLLALCHQRLGQHKAVYDYAKSAAVRGSHLGCSYIFAQSCLAVGKLNDGIHALERARPLWDGKDTTGTSDMDKQEYGELMIWFRQTTRYIEAVQSRCCRCVQCVGKSVRSPERSETSSRMLCRSIEAESILVG